MSRSGVLFSPLPRTRPVRGPVRGRRPAVPGPRQGRLGEEARTSERSPAATERRRVEATPPGSEELPGGAGGRRLTLGELIAGAWEGLLAAGSAICPVCGGRMERDGARGRCGGCGSVLD